MRSIIIHSGQSPTGWDSVYHSGKSRIYYCFYIVIVPVLGIFLHKKSNGSVWMAVLLALVGLYFLCITESFSIGKGDILVFLCALVFFCAYSGD